MEIDIFWSNYETASIPLALWVFRFLLFQSQIKMITFEISGMPIDWSAFDDIKEINTNG